MLIITNEEVPIRNLGPSRRQRVVLMKRAQPALSLLPTTFRSRSRIVPSALLTCRGVGPELICFSRVQLAEVARSHAHGKRMILLGRDCADLCLAHTPP